MNQINERFYTMLHGTALVAADGADTTHRFLSDDEGKYHTQQQFLTKLTQSPLMILAKLVSEDRADLVDIAAFESLQDSSLELEVRLRDILNTAVNLHNQSVENILVVQQKSLFT